MAVVIQPLLDRLLRRGLFTQNKDHDGETKRMMHEDQFLFHFYKFLSFSFP